MMRHDEILREFKSIFSHAGVSKSYLSRKSGVCQSTFRSWETGKVKSPKISTMRMALRELGYVIKVEPK